MLLCGQLKEGHRDRGRPSKRYKDTLKSCNIDVNSWEATACDRALWTDQCTQSTDFEVNRAAAILAKIERRKQRSASVDSFSCSICGARVRHELARIGLHSHMRTHLGKLTCLPTHLWYRQENPFIHTYTYVMSILMQVINFLLPTLVIFKTKSSLISTNVI